MSNIIDQRVVEMRFDNKQFEENVSTSMSTLEKLKNSLRFPSASNGLSDISKSVNSFNMSPIESAVLSVESRFSALGVMGVTALANITNAAINTGTQLIKSLTVAPVSGGYEDYERKLTSMKTIMNATGESKEVVEGYFNTLDEYADKTIYNLEDMTSSFAKFTNAGIDMDKSVPAIKGVANMVALAGQDAGAARIAMYNLSQSIAGGFLTTIDFKSLNYANVATKEWKDRMAEAAVEAGTLTKSADGLYTVVGDDKPVTVAQLFNDELSKQWATTDVLLDVLGEYGDENTEVGKKALAAAQDVKSFGMMMDTLKASAGTGWTDTFEILIGDVDESIALFTPLTETIGKYLSSMSDARNDLLQGWKDLGGRNDLIESVKNAFKGVLSVIKPISEALKEIFPPTTSQQLFNLTSGLKEFTSKMMLSDNASKNLKATFKGLFSVLDIAKQAFSAVFDAIKPLFGEVDNLGGGILALTSKWGDWITRLNKSIKTNNTFGKVMEDIVYNVKWAIDIFKIFIDTIKSSEIYKESLSWLTNNLGKAVSKIKEFIGSISIKFPSNNDVMYQVVLLNERLREFLKTINFKEGIKFPWLESLKTFLTTVKTNFTELITSTGSLKERISKSFEDMGKAAENSLFIKAIKTVFNIVKEVVSGIKDIFSSLGKYLSEGFAEGDFSRFFEFLDGITLAGIGYGIFEFFKKFKKTVKDIKKIKDSVVGVLDSVRGCFEAYQNKLQAETLMTIAKAIGLLTAAIVILSLVDPDKLKQGGLALTGLMSELLGSMAIFSKISGNVVNVGKTVGAMIGLGIALNLLAAACLKLGEADPNQLADGLFALGISMAILVGGLNELASNNKQASQLIVLAIALGIMAGSLKMLSSIEWKQLAWGLGALAISMKVLVDGLNDISKDKKQASQLIVLAIALGIMAGSLKFLSSIPFDKLALGLGALAISMAILVNGLNAISKDNKQASQLVVLSTALAIMALSLKLLSTIPFTSILSGLLGLAGSMAILVLGLKFMPTDTKQASALVVLSAAMMIMAISLKVLASIPWQSMLVGLGGLAAALVILGIAGLIIGPLAPAILQLGIAMAGFGIGVLAVGAGLILAASAIVLFAAGMTALVAIGVAGATTFAASMGIIVTAIAELIPVLAAKMAEGFITFFKTLADKSTELGKSLKTLLLTSLRSLSECKVEVLETLLSFIEGILKSLADHAPGIVDSLMVFLIGVIHGIAVHMPELITAVGELLGPLIDGLINFINQTDFTTIVKGIVGIGLMAALIAGISFIVPFIPGAMVAILGMGAIVAELALVLAAIGGLAQIPGISWLINEGGNLLADIGSAIGKFAGSIISGFAAGITSNLPQIGKDLSDFMINATAFIVGAKLVDSTTIDGVKNLVETVILMTKADIISQIASFITGSSSLVSFGESLLEFAPYIVQFAALVSGIDVLSITGASCAAKILAEMATNLPTMGGLEDKIFGSTKSLSDFAKELNDFGPAIKTYATTVKGVKTEDVEGSANAAKILADMSTTLPNVGGLTQKIFGENKKLSDFGKELESFGPSLKAYIASVAGITPDSVKASADAGQILSDLATNLPNTGGVAAFFSGDNNIETFGLNLKSFGDSLAAYGTSVASLDANAIINSANAAIALSSFANSIPETGGFISLFAGDNNIISFGENLVSFGDKLSGYYESIKTIDTAILTAVITEVNNLIAMAKTMLDVDTSAMSSFAQALKTLGKNGVDEFIKSFTDAEDDVETAAKDMIQKFIDGAENKKDDLKNKFSDLLDAAIEKIDTFWDDFKTVGAYMVDGFCNGITENIWKAEAQARLMAQAADSAARDELGINSPSKVGYSIGNFFGLGFVKGISDYEEHAYNSSAGMADYAKKGLSNAVSKINDFVENGIDTQPTIRPVLDLSNLESGTRRISSLFSSSQAMSIGSSMLRSQEPKIINNNNSHSIGDIIVNVYGSNGDATSTGQEIGYQIERKLRYAGI